MTLLSHEGNPHYHRRLYRYPYLSSGWDQVVPMLYGRQAIRCYVVFSLHGVKGGSVIEMFFSLAV